MSIYKIINRLQNNHFFPLRYYTMLTSKPYMPFCVSKALKGSPSGQKEDPHSGRAAGR